MANETIGEALAMAFGAVGELLQMTIEQAKKDLAAIAEPTPLKKPEGNYHLEGVFDDTMEGITNRAILSLLPPFEKMVEILCSRQKLQKDVFGADSRFYSPRGVLTKKELKFHQERWQGKTEGKLPDFPLGNNGKRLKMMRYASYKKFIHSYNRGHYDLHLTGYLHDHYDTLLIDCTSNIAPIRITAPNVWYFDFLFDDSVYGNPTMFFLIPDECSVSAHEISEKINEILLTTKVIPKISGENSNNYDENDLLF